MNHSHTTCSRVFRAWSICGRSLSAVVLLGLVAAAGCSGTKQNFVTGKVTLDGKPVAGTVTFIGPNNKKVQSPIGRDGTYSVLNPEPGENKITVTGMPKLGATDPMGGRGDPRAADMVKKQTEMMKANAPEDAVFEAEPPPEKYATPGNIPAFTVTSGKQIYDIPLTP